MWRAHGLAPSRRLPTSKVATSSPLQGWPTVSQGFLRLIALLFSCLTVRINESFSKTHLKNYSFIIEKLVSFGDGKCSGLHLNRARTAIYSPCQPNSSCPTVPCMSSNVRRHTATSSAISILPRALVKFWSAVSTDRLYGFGHVIVQNSWIGGSNRVTIDSIG
jgi:hypothetical protein